MAWSPVMRLRNSSQEFQRWWWLGFKTCCRGGCNTDEKPLIYSCQWESETTSGCVEHECDGSLSHRRPGKRYTWPRLASRQPPSSAFFFGFLEAGTDAVTFKLSFAMIILDTMIILHAMIILHSHLQPPFKNELFHILHIISLLTGDMNSINWPRSQCVAS